MKYVLFDALYSKHLSNFTGLVIIIIVVAGRFFNPGFFPIGFFLIRHVHFHRCHPGRQ